MGGSITHPVYGRSYRRLIDILTAQRFRVRRAPESVMHLPEQGSASAGIRLSRDGAEQGRYGPASAGLRPRE